MNFGKLIKLINNKYKTWVTIPYQTFKGSIVRLAGDSSALKL